MKNTLLRRALSIAPAFFAILIFAGVTFATDYTSINNGPWSSDSTWAGNEAPGSDISSLDTVRVRHAVNYDLGADLKNNGTIIIEPIAGTNAFLLVPSGRSVENSAPAPRGFYIRNASFLQCRFGVYDDPTIPGTPAPDPYCSDNNGEPYTGGSPGPPPVLSTTPLAPKLAGSFKNKGGYVEVINSDVEVAQDWTSENGGIRYMRNSCLRTGQNYSISGAASYDTLIAVNISIAWHTSGNFQLADGTIHFNTTKIQVAGPSGSFQLNSGKAFGDIDLITLKNHITGYTGTGEIFASSSLSTTGISIGGVEIMGLTLIKYCVSVPSQYKPNGKFSGTTPGTPMADCTTGFSTSDCQTLIPSASGVDVGGRVTTSDGTGIYRAMLVISGGALETPISVITNGFGYYSFSDIPVGETYIVTITSKSHTFPESTRVLTLDDAVSGFDFTAMAATASPTVKSKRGN